MGVIYVIGCDGPERYVGSTKISLSERWRQHRKKSNDCCSKAIIDKYGSDACWIEPLEEVADDSLLLERERHWIENMPGCINQRLPGRTDTEHIVLRREYSKYYYDQNRQYWKDRYAALTSEYRRTLVEANRKRYAALTPEQRAEINANRRAKRRAALKAVPDV
jgi:hypothetical protein